jgi:hypothetical protein
VAARLDLGRNLELRVLSGEVDERLARQHLPVHGNSESQHRECSRRIDTISTGGHFVHATTIRQST